MSTNTITMEQLERLAVAVARLNEWHDQPEAMALAESWQHPPGHLRMVDQFREDRQLVDDFHEELQRRHKLRGHEL